MQLGKFVVLLIVVSTLSRLTSGQPTVDTELTNDGCHSSDGDSYSLLRALLELLQQQGSSSAGPNTDCKPRK